MFWNKPGVKSMLFFAGAVILAVSSPSLAYAQGSIFGAVQNSNATTPANGDITFVGFLDNTDEEIRIESSTGAGYDAGNWFDDFQNYLTEAPGNPYDYYFFNSANGEGAVLSDVIPNNSFQQEDIALSPVAWPSQPTGLSGTAISGSSVVVSWNGVPGLTYHVYRRLATSSGSFFRRDNTAGQLSDPGVSDSFFVDTGVDGISSYDYIIIAEDGSGNYSQHSTIITVNSASVVAPVVTSITPNNGPPVGGTNVTIIGAGFDPAGVTANVGLALTGVTVVSPYEITGSTQATAPSSVDVSVTNSASGLQSNVLTGGFTFNTDAFPTLDPIGAQSTPEGVNLSFVVTSSDPESTPTITTSALPSTATFTPNGSGGGTFDWTPTFLESGVYQVTFRATDNIAQVDSEVVTITVTEAGNQAPVVASIGPRNTTENVNLNFVVSSSDAESTPVMSANNLPTGATFTPNGSGGGTFDWTPTFLQSGVYNVSFLSTDDSLAVDSEVVAITVNDAGNQLPILATIGPRNGTEGVNLNFAVSSTDIESTPVVSTSSLSGGATFTPNGSGGGTFDWTPTFVQAGAYDVTFYATDDSAAVDSEVVTITISESGNQLPVLAAIGPQSTTENVNLNFAVSSTDAESTPTVSTVNLPTGATFTPNGSGGGTFDWTPTYLQSGVYNVTFIATDASLAADTEIVAITVIEAGNQLPVLAAIGPRNTTENVNLNFAVSSTDIESTPVVSTGPLPSGATFTPNGSGGGTFDWTPDFLQSGVYNVMFYATDDSTDVDSELVTITVTDAGNQLPVLAAIGPRNTTENVNLNFSVSSTDIESTPVVSTGPLPSGATFTPNGSGGGTFDWTPDFLQSGVYNVMFYATDDSLDVDSEQVTITVSDGGNQAPVLAAIGPQGVTEGLNLNFVVSSTDIESTPIVTTSTLPSGATFTPNGSGGGTFDWTLGFTTAGVYNVTFYATDDSAAVDSEIVTITVSDAGNQFPILDPIGPQVTTENVNLNFVITSSDAETTPTASAVNLPTGATFTPNGAGGGTFDWTPSYVQSGVFNVTFISTDGGGLADSEIVAITVNEAGNQLPVLAAIGPQNTTEGLNLNFAVSSTDPESTPLVTTTSLPTGATFTPDGLGGGTFDWTPSYVQSGVYNVTFYASDDSTEVDSEIVAITVIDAGNQAPVLAAIGPQAVVENTNLNFVVTSTDAESTPNVTTSALPGTATFTPDFSGGGTFDWTPGFTDAGSYPVTFYSTDDSTAVDSEVVVITVTESGNQPPTLTAIGPQSGTEQVNLNFLVTATDPETIPTLSTSTLPAGATFTDLLDGSGTFDWTPSVIQGGVYDITFYATDDGAAIDSEIVTITIADIGNQDPVLDSIRAKTVSEGVNLNFLVTASDSESVPTLTTSVLPSGALFTDNLDGTGAFDWTPGFAQSGVYPITFYATDDSLAIDSEIVTITVTETGNQGPIITGVTDTTVLEGGSLQLVYTAVDPDGVNPPSISISATLSNANFVDSGNGVAVLTYNPTFFDGGLDSAIIFATDDAVPPITSQLKINIATLEVNQQPNWTPAGPFAVLLGDQLQFNVVASDSTDNIPGHILTLSLTDPPANSNFVDNGNNSGTFTFNPASGQAGVDTLHFLAVDQGVPPLSRTLTVIVSVVNQNQKPVMTAMSGQTVVEGQSLVVNVTSSDPDGDILTLSMRNAPANSSLQDNGDGTGVFTFNPDFTQGGSVGASKLYGVTFVSSDGLATAQRLVYIQVYDAGNQTPVVDTARDTTIFEGDTLELAVYASDPDGDIPSLSADSLPINASFTDNGDGTGLITFRPVYVQAGTYTIFINAFDQSSSSTTPVVITVLDAGNQPPRLPVDSIKIDFQEGDLINSTIQAVDPDSTTPLLSATGLPFTATFTDNGDGSGTINWQTAQQQAGVYLVVVYAVDEFSPALYDSALIVIEIIDVNLQPNLLPFPAVQNRTVSEGSTLQYVVRATDADGTIPILTMDTAVYIPNVTFVDSGNGIGVLTFTPDYTQGLPNPGRQYFVSFKAEDANDPNLFGSIPSTQFTVLNTNRPPDITPVASPITMTEGDTVNFIVQATDPDQASTLTFPTLTVVGLPTNATRTYLGGTTHTLSFTFTPNFTQAGTYNVSFIGSDGSVADTMIIQIDVQEAGNQTPVWLTNLTATTIVVAGNPSQFHLVSSDADADPVTITTPSTLPLGAALADSGNGRANFIFNPDISDVGSSFPVMFVVTDPSLAADTIQTTFTVQAFLRGDSNSDSRVDLTDIVFLIDYTFRSGRAPVSVDAADVNFDSSLNINDVSYLTNYLFKNGPPPVQ